MARIGLRLGENGKKEQTSPGAGTRTGTLTLVHRDTMSILTADTRDTAPTADTRDTAPTGADTRDTAPTADTRDTAATEAGDGEVEALGTTIEAHDRAVYEQFNLRDPEKDIIPPAGVNTTAVRWRDAEACSSRATRVVLEDEDDAEHEHQVAQLALKERKGYAGVRVNTTLSRGVPAGSSSSATKNRRSSAQAKEFAGSVPFFFREELHRGQSKYAGDGLATDPTKCNVGPALSRFRFVLSFVLFVS
eukprot:g14677.t1